MTPPPRGDVLGGSDLNLSKTFFGPGSDFLRIKGHFESHAIYTVVKEIMDVWETKTTALNTWDEIIWEQYVLLEDTEAVLDFPPPR